LNSWINW